MVEQKPKVEYSPIMVYFCKVLGRPVRFFPRADEVVATFNPLAAPGIIEALQGISGVEVRVANPARGFSVLRLSPSSPREALLAQINGLPEIWNATVAMVNEERATVYALPDEVVVQFRVPDAEALALIEELGSFVVVKQRSRGLFTVAVREGSTLWQTLNIFSARREVAFVEVSAVSMELEESVVGLPATASIDHFAYLWALENKGQKVNGVKGKSGADINAIEAWNITRGHPSVVIAVIDSGVDLAHVDLLDNILPRNGEDWDFSSSSSDIPSDSNGHGTHVAGIVSALNDKSGVVGVAPECCLMPLKVSLFGGTYSDKADALDYVAAQARLHSGRRYVANCSWGDYVYDKVIHSAVNNALGAGVVVIAAAGNGNSSIDTNKYYPAFHAGVVAVAATDQWDKRWSGSNYGARIDVSAPGSNIFSTKRGGVYGFSHGTSTAAAYTAGLAALIWSKKVNLTNWEVIDIIKDWCDGIGYGGKMGRGRINAFRALRHTENLV